MCLRNRGLKIDIYYLLTYFPICRRTGAAKTSTLGLSSLLPNPRDPSITTRLRFANKFPRLPKKYEKISDIYFLCSISLSDFIAIEPSILVFCSCFLKISSTSVWLQLYVSVYSLHCILLFVCLPCAVLFGLMATRLNKHYYYLFDDKVQLTNDRQRTTCGVSFWWRNWLICRSCTYGVDFVGQKRYEVLRYNISERRYSAKNVVGARKPKALIFYTILFDNWTFFR